MTFARFSHTATLLRSGKVLVAGGWAVASQVTTPTAELYDPSTETWTVTGSMKTPRAFHVAVLLPSGKVLVAGGQRGSSPIQEARVIPDGAIASAELYDPDTGTWTETADMPVGGDSFAAIVLRSGKVFVTTRIPFSATGAAELYDPASGSWSTIGSSVQLGSATILASGKVLVVGAYALSAELYDPVTNAWRATGDMMLPRTGHTATLLPSGKVLIAGGGDGEIRNRPYSTADVYNPVTDTWTQARSMTTQHSGGTGTLLPSGDVLIAGGVTGRDGLGTRNSVDLYHPPTATWTALGVMGTVRSSFTATLLGSGAVLFAGGQGFSFASDPYASAEIYALTCP